MITFVYELNRHKCEIIAKIVNIKKNQKENLDFLLKITKNNERNKQRLIMLYHTIISGNSAKAKVRRNIHTNYSFIPLKIFFGLVIY